MSKIQISRESRLYRFAVKNSNSSIELIDACDVLIAAAYGVGRAVLVAGCVIFIWATLALSLFYNFSFILGAVFQQVVHGSGVMSQPSAESFLWGLTSVTSVLAIIGVLAAVAFVAFMAGVWICSKFKVA